MAGVASGAQLAAEVNKATLLTAALAYARLGWPVLPVAGIVGGTCGCRARARCTHPAKHPLIKDGTASATLDLPQLHEWWTYWPWAGIGIVTGARSQLVVVDVDPRHDGNKTLTELVGRHELSTVTLTARTGSGGIHLCYRLPADRKAGNTSGRLPGIGDTPGVDVRGDGGYIVAAPSSHHSGRRYQWDPHSPTLASAPPCTLRPQQHPCPPSPRPRVQAGPRGGADYVTSALDGELARVAAAAEGVRNDTLNRAAFSLGTLVGADGLARGRAEEALAATAEAVGIPSLEAARTIRSGLDAGEKRPRQVAAGPRSHSTIRLASLR